MSRPPLCETRLDELLDAIADRSPAPASGFVSGVVVAMAAALTAMAARRSRDGWPEADGVIAQAEHLRRRAAPLAQENADAFGEAFALLDAPAQGRDVDLGRALTRAAEVPLMIAQVAADVAALAKEVAECGDPTVRGDATGAALLAQAAARSAAHLVEINLGVLENDERLLRATRLAADAAAASARTLAGAR